MNRQIETYLKKVTKLLTCSAKPRTRFIAHLEDSVNDFISESPGCTIEDVIAFLGPPEALARDFMETLDEEEINRGKRNRLIKKVALIVLILGTGIVLFIIFGQSLLSSAGTLITGVSVSSPHK